MRAGLFLLGLAYIFSQFFRAFLAVLTDVLKRDIGADPQDLALASGLWFLSFAAMQIPVGWALDRIGPRRTASVLFLFGGAGGALLFSLASTPLHISAAMGLIGIGCSPVLMASYYLFARLYPPAMFATLGAVMIGTGSLGNLAGSAPLTYLVSMIGWRATMLVLSAISAAVALGIWRLVDDPPRVDTEHNGSVLDLLRMPALWLIFPLMFVGYAPAAGLRGLWVGPYLSDVFGASQEIVGNATLIMGVAMILGTYAYGPMDRWLGTRKWVVFGGNLITAIGCLMLAAIPLTGFAASVALFATIGFFGLSFPLIMAHGRSFIPAHLTGRGVTLMNLFSIGGVGFSQVVTGHIHAAAKTGAVHPSDSYTPILWFFGLVVLAGLAIYLFSQDRVD